MLNQSHLTREIILKERSNAFLRDKWIIQPESILPLQKTTIIIDSLQDIDTVKIIKELLSNHQVTIFSDLLDEHNWCNYCDQEFEVVLADLRYETSLYSYQYINIIQLLKSKHIVFLTNIYAVDQLQSIINIPIDNILEIPYTQTCYEEQFISIPFDQKLSYVLQQIKQSNTEVDRDILIYCETLFQMDQLYQAIHFHNQISGESQFQVHQILPCESYYREYVQQIMEIAYPSANGKRQIFLCINYRELKKYLQGVKNQISLIIHMGYEKTIKSFMNSITAIVYKQCNLSKMDILIRNRVAYYPKVIYLYSSDEFKQLSQGTLINEEEFNFNPENLKLRINKLNLKLDKFADVEIQEYTSVNNYIPSVYYEPLLEAENETFQYYCYVVSTLLTEGEILSEGNLDSKQNPFKNYQIHQQREAIIRSNHYWSKIGDITSWIQLINKFTILIEDICQKEDNNESENAKNELIKWCRLQNINIPKMILILAFNEYLIELTEKYQTEYSVINKCCSLETLKLNRTISLKKQQSMPEHSEDIQACLLRLFYKGLCIFSGHKSAGYHNYVTDQTFKLCYNNLMAIIGDFPLTCIVMALLYNNKTKQFEIKYSTKIDDIMIPQIAPKNFVKQYKLQFIQRQSLHLQELTFNGIGQVLFNELWKYQAGPQLSQDCILQPNMEMNCITVLFDPKVANKETIEQELNGKIKELQNFFRNQVREIPYENDSKFIMQAGGSMKDWIEKSAYKTFFIEGLPLDITQESLEEFLGDAKVSEMKLYKEGNQITARISLQNHDDLVYCIENIKDYKGSELRVYTQQDQFEYHEQKLHFNEQYKVVISWNLHINKGVGKLILNKPFDIESDDFKRIDDFTYQMTQVDMYADEKELITKLSANYKSIDIKEIQLEKQFRYENNGDIVLEIEKLVNNLCNDKYVIDSIIKQNSKRILTLSLHDINTVEKLQQLDNQIKQFRGLKVKLCVHPFYYHEYEGAIEMKQIVEEIFDEKQLQGQYTLLVDSEQKRIKVKIECWNKKDHEAINKEISSAFETRILKSEQDLDITLLFSQSGMRFLKFVEQELQIIIKQDFINNKILVNSSQIKYNQLLKAVQQFLKDCTKCTIQIPKNCIRLIMGNDSQGLNEIKKNFELKSVKFNSISGELQLFGDQKNLDAAIVSLSEILQSQQLDKPISALTCNYCFDNMKNGYMLQGCGHKFCLQCIMFSVQNSLGDMTQLPIKCPQCNSPVLLADLYILLDEPSWEKLIKLSINKYLQDHAAQIAFCLTPNCPIIHFQKIPRYTCKKCKKQYCNSCRTAYHYGQTCREFKAGNEDSINIYMKKNDVRRCPHCKILIQRIDGCYRVTCTGCKKSICWKNKADGTPCMEIFETSSECYSHLTKEHGGYW